ncbi:cingulin-like protein 1 isoform X1 [Hypanus sabinus]|uniref:cingulin-like protein 1 isoform X1 n=1 Tax=Hypanus sabinus TaxID=79690 RepID=UPI0028C46BC7|nr:cingulin-like protein 1 isoform X1 [Hypanus sabinus]XP_059808535.1 cingulin-like protein 1 isoform X1 [Hypanus sabinus]
MDSYLDTIQDKQMQRDYGIQIRFIQDPHEEATKAESHRTANSKAGSYGVSIRVQGIDGQPYVVLNSNQEGQMQMYEPSPENGCFNPTLPQDNFKPYSGPYAKKPRNTASTNGHFTFPESQHFDLRRPSPYLPLLRTETPKVKDDNSHVKAGDLLNFQKHPEILKPYNPEKSVLEQAGWQRLTSNVTAEKNIDSSLHHKPKPEFSRKLDAGMSNPVKASDERNRISKLDQSKRTAGLLSRKPDSGNSKGKGRNGTSSDLEDSRTARPDLLPSHRQRPGGRGVEAPVLRKSFSTTVPAASDNKLWVDDPDEELSAENINRHENRRYIPFFPGTGRDIDSDHIPGVDELIDKFDGKEGQHRRGRSARRNRIDPEDRKRSRSVDSVFPLKRPDNFPYSDRKFGATNEHLLRPSQLRRQSAITQRPGLSENPQVSHTVSSGSLGRYPEQTADRQGNVKNGLVKSSSQTKVDGEATNEPQERTMVKSSALPVGANNKSEAKREEVVPVTQKHLGKTALSFIRINKKGLDPLVSQDTCDNDVPVTPDLLKDQQTNEETAKQILYNYLKEGSQDDDATKKKVNLVFEKIQTLKSKGVAAVKDQKEKKDDISSEFQVLLEQRNELEKNAVAIEKKAEELQRKLDEVTKIQQNDREQKDRTKDNLRNLQREMEENIEENNRLREQLAKSDKELRNQLEELVQVKMEREQYQSEIRDLQDQLSEMHDELDCAKFPADNEEEKETLMMEMIEAKQQLEEVLIAKEDQQEMLRRRERELTALRGVLKEEVSNHDREMEELKEQHEKEKQKLKKIIDDLLQSKTKLEQENIETKRAKNAVEDQVRNLMDEKESLKKKVDKLEAEVGDLNQIIDNMKEEENRQKDKLAHVEQEKKQLEAALREVGDQEQDISFAKRALESQLEDAQRNLNKKSQDNQELRERLQTEAVQKDLLKKTKNEMENEKRQLEKMVEKLQKEMAEVTKDSQRSNLDLRKDLDDCKEKSRTQLTSLQQQLKTKGLEAEKSQLMTKKLQDEIRRLREEMEDCSQERDEALLKSQQLRQNVSDLERDLESKVHCVDDRVRQVKQIEDKLVDLEMELEEERNNSDLLTDRINRDREQIEQMRSELFQERAARQDLECDKVSLERQHKDLKSRIAYLEGSQKQNKEGIVTQLEARVQELEERLEEEERERSTLQLNNRKLERKAKELMLQTDDERLHLADQKDQLNLRLKALKRQVDEAEEEIDRLENAKRKLQRELEEQIETNEELQGQMNALKKDLRRKNSVAKVSSSILNDYENDYSTDEDSIYDTDFRPSKNDNL